MTLVTHVNPGGLAKGLCLARGARDYLALFADVWRRRLSECVLTVSPPRCGHYQRQGRLPGRGSHPLCYHLSLAEGVRGRCPAPAADGR